MPKIRVDSDGVNTLYTTMQRQAKAIQDVAHIFSQVSTDLDMQVAASEGIRQSIDSLQNMGNQQQVIFDGMSGFLTKVNDNFLRTDQSIANQTKELVYLCNHISWSSAFQKGATPILSLLEISHVNQSFGITLEGTTTIEFAMEAIRRFNDTQATRAGKVSAEGEALYNYLKENNSSLLFGEYDFALHFVNDLNWWDGFMYSLKNWKEAFASMLFGGGSAENAAKRFMENPDECKAVLRDVIDDICGTEYLDVFSSDEDKVIDALKDLAEISGLSSAADLIDQVNDWVGDAEAADKILKNYGANIAMLESLKDLAPGSSVLSKTVDSLIQEYRSQTSTMLFDDLKSKVQDGLIDIVDYTLGTNITAVDKVIQKVLGEVPALDAINTVVYSSDMRCSAIMAFRNAAESIQSGNFTNADLIRYKNSFQLAKALTIEQYNGMKDYYKSDSKEAQYLENQIQQLESMTYMDFGHATSFSAFNTGSGGRGF